MNIEMPVISKFSYNYQEIVQGYCDKINNSDAELFIVMARKGVCFFDILRDDGLIKLTAEQKVISSSALDFKPITCPDKKVVVTDDIMISGTSISNVINELLDMGVPEQNISIIVLAVDSENMKLDFTMESGFDLLQQGWMLPNADCIELSSQISNVLSVFGRPYDVDFPVYNPVTIKKSRMGSLLNPNLWNVYNVTNQFQSSGRIEAITLIPTQHTLKLIWDRLGLESDYFAHIKIRLYIKDTDDQNFSLQFVPFFLFYEICYSQIDELCFALSESNFEDLCYSAKLRICQFVLCHKLAVIFSDLSKCDINISFRNSVVTSLFGYEYASIVMNLIFPKEKRRNKVCFKYTEAPLDLLDYSHDEHESILDFVQKIPPHVISNDSRELNLQLLQPFVSWYLTRELPTRKSLTQGGYNFRKDRHIIQSKTYRLDSGYSFRSLNTIFVDHDGNYRWPDVVSIFLDRSIDMGIIVPIMFDNNYNRTVCRAFRHGEDLPFGVADKSRILFFLQQLQKEFASRKCEGIAHISLEKIIVLFIHMAIRDKGIFNQFLGFRNREVLSIRYSVHGAVATTISSDVDTSSLKYYFDAAPYWDWVTNYLSKKGMIVRRSSAKNNPNHYICANAFDEYEKQFNNICNEIQVKIKKYASIFAEWYGAMHLRQRDDFKNQVIQLSTCFSVPTVAAALATELHYFYRYWDEEVQLGFKKYADQSNLFTTLSIPGMDAARVLNSAREKFAWFEEKAHIKTISDVKDLLDTRSSYLSADWEGKWHAIASSKRYYSPKLITKYYECYCYLLICSACYELLSGGELADTEIDQIEPNAFSRIAEYEEQFLMIKQKHELPIDDFHELFSFVSKDNFSLKDISKRIETLSRYMNCVLAYANIVVEDIQQLVSEQTMETPVYFSNCIIVDLQCKDEEKCISIVEGAWDALPDNEHKTLMNVFKLKDNAGDEQYQRYGFFYAYDDEISRKTTPPMNQIISFIYGEAEKNCINNRFIVVPHLPPPCRLKYSYKSNMQSEIEAFNKTVCDQIIPYFKERVSSQIILIQKSDTALESVNAIPGFSRKYPVALDYDKLQWPTLANYSLTLYENGHRRFPRLEQNNVVNNSIASLHFMDAEGAKCSKLIGTATLCTYNGVIYALTCMHCLSEDVDQTYTLKLKTYGYNMLYGKVVNLNSIPQEDLPAEQEVAVLQAYWDSDCTEAAYFEPGMILNISSDFNSTAQSNLTCFGYPSERGLTINATKYYEANDGYLEFIVDNCDRFKSGFSGALFIDENRNPFAIAYSYQENGRTHAYGIPLCVATMRAREIIDEGV